jgi:predicted metal-binding protein
MTTVITICDTCKTETWDADKQDKTDGEVLAALIETAAKGVQGVQTRRHPCLMGCSHGCNIAIQAQGKLTYVLGRFMPDQAQAEGIVEYARLHSESAKGQVPFRQWPKAIKGHFVSRIPGLPSTEV